jgi:hypothetical protein
MLTNVRFWRAGLSSLVAFVMLTLPLTVTGCAQTERKEVRMTETQEEGEVRDVPPGDEMIVE